MNVYNVSEFSVITAIKAMLESFMDVKLPVFRGDDFTEKMQYPCAFVAPVSVIEPTELTGTATMVVSVRVGAMTTVEQPLAKHIEATGAVMDLIFNDDFVTRVNNKLVDGLIVQQVTRSSRSTSIDADAGTRTTGQQLDILCSMNG